MAACLTLDSALNKASNTSFRYTCMTVLAMLKLKQFYTFTYCLINNNYYSKTISIVWHLKVSLRLHSQLFIIFYSHNGLLSIIYNAIKHDRKFWCLPEFQQQYIYKTTRVC